MMAVIDDQAAQPQETLARTRRWATGVLAALAAVFLASHAVGDAPGWLLLVRSMAEAGMIGGLADWFAVTALFRHPLGLPIPHTALLPRNQARAARNVGRFLETHFLIPEQVQARVRALEPSKIMIDWLQRPENARVLARQLVDLGAAPLERDLPPRLLVRARALLRREALKAGSDDAIAAAVATLAKAGMRSGIARDVLALLRREIDENRDAAVALVQENSRWWIATPIDRRVAGLAVNAVLSLLDDLEKEDSPLRRQTEKAFDNMIDTLARDGALDKAVAEARAGMVRSGFLERAASALIREFRDRFDAQLAQEPDALVDPLADLIRDTARQMLSHPDDSAALDCRVAELAGRLVSGARAQIADYVADVIAGWAPEELNARFEEEIGSDLQFIRINGALLGALIGGALFCFEALIG